MEWYRYCSIRPKDKEKSYFYISDVDIEKESYVLVPFGYRNRLHKGIVEDVGLYTEEDAPYPVEQTKRIIRSITEEEYFAPEDAEWKRYAETFVEDIQELEEFLEDEDYEAVFEWACERHNCTRFPDVMETVIHCYRLCIQHGNPTAALNLGTLYYNGTYLRQDFEEAARLYEIAAEAGDKRAICNLGYCYYYGRHQPPDYQKAYYYYHLGALLFDDPNCLYKLGDMYRRGEYVERSDKFAAMLYFRALTAVNRSDEDRFCLGDILLRVGETFLEGLIGERDAKKALDCFFQALSCFYDRRTTDPFVGELIDRTKENIREAEEILENELL